MPRDTDKTKRPPSRGKAPPRRGDGPPRGRDGAPPRFGKGPPRSRDGDAPRFDRSGGKGPPRARDGDAPRGKPFRRDDDRKFGDRPTGERKFGDRKPAGRSFADRKDGPRDVKPRGDRPRPDRERGGERAFSERKFSDRKFSDRGPSDRKPSDRKPPDRNYADRKASDRPFSDRTSSDRSFADRKDGVRGFKPREFKPRGDRPKFGEDRPARADRNDRPRRFDDRPHQDRPRQDRPGEDRPRQDRGDRPRQFEDRGPRREGTDRPTRKFEDRGPRREGADRPPRKFDDRAPRGDRPFKPREDRPRREESGGERRTFSRPRQDRDERPRNDDRPRRFRESGERNAWQEHPRSERAPRDSQSDRPRDLDRPRRDNEDDSQIFAKRPAFGGRGAYRARFDDRSPSPPKAKPEKTGERIAKLVARAGLCSRRDAEDWITQGRVAVNGRVINSPALDITSRDVVTIDGKPLPPPERTRLFLYHKPRGLMTTHADPEGRPTVFDHLPEGLPRLISIGRLDFNTEGLLLLTNDGGLARTLELPDTGWLRRYRVRAHGDVTQAQLDQLKDGVDVDGVKYGAIDAQLERDQGANVWIVFAMREGKNREVRNVLAHLGLEVNRLIRVSYGPFQLGEIAEGAVDEVKTRVLRDQLGDKIASASKANFAVPPQSKGDIADDPAPRRKPGKRDIVADSKGRRVRVERSGSEEARARNEDAASRPGPPRRPQRGYHGKRDLTPKED